ncbi:MAG: hypothetical protein HYY65_09120 [Candidatus Tectomicrobia bacterium]|uniref:Uncharacterized protein n=1 Tax=Tectimicrobiota bacterium TaxID=2528274 RepID=A0A932GPZ0_UNCTE|nr:hypothetical protein [Candidatus Tectomicrobia bacterium]
MQRTILLPGILVVGLLLVWVWVQAWLGESIWDLKFAEAYTVDPPKLQALQTVEADPGPLLTLIELVNGLELELTGQSGHSH